MRDHPTTVALPEWLEREDHETVVVAFPDVLGRLMGKRFCAGFFRDEVAASGTHACNYLLTVDVEMEPQVGFRLANWEQGYGDFHLRVDVATLRPLPWLEKTALALADLEHPDGSPVAEAPRTLLRRQLDRLADRGLSASAASELEFYLYREDYRTASEKQYRGLVPSSHYLIDYHLTQPSQDEDVLGRLRRSMNAARVVVEGSKGEWGRGQHEVNLLYADALEAADRHVLFKHGTKEIAAQHGRAVTFMAKPATDEAGSSCHIHLSVWDSARTQNRFADGEGASRLFRQFLGGLVRYGRELCYFFAPTVNSYKRYQPASWAPTALVWAMDNRTTGFRVVGQGRSFRVENRMPGADANPYLAYAAMIAAGLAGVEEGLDCGDAYRGNAYADGSLPKLPSTLEEAARLLDGSDLARRAFGDSVVDFYVHTARLEAEAARRAVTDWERARYFERI
jgi:glutamine synthetase